MVDGLSQTQLEDQCLQPSLQEILWSQSQHVIKLVLVVVQKTVLVHTSQQGLALKQSLLRGLRIHQARVQAQLQTLLPTKQVIDKALILVLLG